MTARLIATVSPERRSRPVRPLVFAALAALALSVTAPRMACAEAVPAAAVPDTTSPRELRTEVPELNDMYAAIHGMWNEAAARRDFALMRAYLPDIENATEALAHATLPRVLRDRQAEWTSAVDTVRISVSVYGDAARGRDNEALLLAAGRVRTRFGELVQSIHPPFSEIDLFHAALHPLVHGSLPAGNLPAIRASVRRLARPMRDLNRGTLPGWLSSREADFIPARRRLSLAVDRLIVAANGSDLKRIRAAADSLHTCFEELAHLLD